MRCTNCHHDPEYQKWGPHSPVWSPLRGDKGFREIYRQFGPRTLVTPDRVYILYQLAYYARKFRGTDWVECGVYKGGTAYLLSRLMAPNQTLFLLDTFSGIPPGDKTIDGDGYHEGGKFSETSVKEVLDALKGAAGKVEAVPGKIPTTFSQLPNKRMFSFVHLDLDIYNPTCDAIRHFKPRMIPGGIMIFDDYGFEECRGVKQAVDEFLGSDAVILPTGQALVIC
jgi:O-methyltransferase